MFERGARDNVREKESVRERKRGSKKMGGNLWKKGIFERKEEKTWEEEHEKAGAIFFIKGDVNF